MKRYRDSHQNQITFLPLSLDSIIDANHQVRVVDKFVSELPSSIWNHLFPGGGAPAHSPRMMLKVILYAYSCKTYTSRHIARAVRQDITYMWLAGMEQPSFNTINRFRRRSALREVAKVYGLPKHIINRMTESLPYWFRIPPDGTTAAAESPYAELKETYPFSEHKKLFRDAGSLIGYPRHLSIHPGGIVITPRSLNELLPTQTSTKGVRITQFDLHSIEYLGLVKIDLLGIKALTVLGDVADRIIEEKPAFQLHITGELVPCLPDGGKYRYQK